MWTDLGVGVWPMLVASVAAVSGTTKPNFSGSWKLNIEKSRLEIDPPTKAAFAIEHNERRFKLTRTLAWGEKSDTLTFETTTDGRQNYLRHGAVESWTRAFWKEDGLVLNSKVKYRDEEGTNVVHYWLEDGGRTLVAAEWFSVPSHKHNNLWVFDRAEGEG